MNYIHMTVRTVLIIAGVLVLPLAAGAQWTGPTQAPTGGNTSAPLNISSSAQSKIGGLLLNTGGATNGLIVQLGNVGIGTVSPLTKLHVTDKFLSESSQPGLILMDTSGNANENWWIDSNSGVFRLLTVNDARSSWQTALAAYQSAGTPTNIYLNANVGVGVSSPDAKVRIDRNTTTITDETAYALKITDGTADTGILLGVNATGDYSVIQSLDPGTGWSTRPLSLMPNGGSVGIGTVGPAYKLDVNGDVINNGWYRSRGSTGWYNESYGGGWYMIDSTWIRSYNSKPVYMSAGFDTGVASGVGCSGGMGGSYTLQVCGSAGIGAAAFYYTSDKTLKENIEKLDGETALENIKKLRGVSFDWRDSGRSSVGVIAQEVEAVYPELIKTDEKTGLKSVEYANLVAPLIEAIKEQQRQIEALMAEVEALKTR